VVWGREITEVQVVVLARALLLQQVLELQGRVTLVEATYLAVAAVAAVEQVQLGPQALLQELTVVLELT
jgi:hypothetical protein